MNSLMNTSLINLATAYSMFVFPNGMDSKKPHVKETGMTQNDIRLADEKQV